jgi:hypothetical protein
VDEFPVVRRLGLSLLLDPSEESSFGLRSTSFGDPSSTTTP